MCEGWLSVCCDAGNAKTHEKVMSRYRNEINPSQGLTLTSTPEEEYTDLTAEKETVPVACFFGVGVDVPSPCVTYAQLSASSLAPPLAAAAAVALSRCPEGEGDTRIPCGGGGRLREFE